MKPSQKLIPEQGVRGEYAWELIACMLLLVARVLLMSDQSQGQPSHNDGQIAEALSISRRTVIRIKQRSVQENLEVPITGSFPRKRPERRCLNGKGEAQLIAMACSQAPDGRQRWTLELLVDRMVFLGYIEDLCQQGQSWQEIATSELAPSTGNFARRMCALN